MNKVIEVKLGERSYPIVIGSNSLDLLCQYLSEIKFPRKISIITNDTVAPLYLEKLTTILCSEDFQLSSISIPDGEEYKTLNTFETIIGELIASGHDRSSGLIALGGGVVGDIVGFVAASYLRGVPFVQVPTTLLAQVDSSVGGKTAVNHSLGKNLIGAFYQPSLVCIDVETLQTLPYREYAAGLAEVIKYGIIRDRSFFEWVCDNKVALRDKQQEALIHAISRSCQIKADIVEIDEREGSLRAILNFGHTLGHAVEKLSGYGSFLHGEAVSIGMIAASRISEKLNLCTDSDVSKIEQLLKFFELPTELPEFSLDDYLEVVSRDKKVLLGKLRIIANCEIGHCKIVDVENPREILGKVIPTS